MLALRLILTLVPPSSFSLCSASFFPTTKVLQRAIVKKKAQDSNSPLPPPFSPALVKRITSIVNAELLAVCTIPLFASLMARGVGGTLDWLPWQAGAAPSFLAVGLLGSRYIKKALDWDDGEQQPKQEQVQQEGANGE